MITLPTIFIYHIRSLALGILVVSGMVSFGILYAVLSSPHALRSGIPEGGQNVSLAEDTFERVLVWIDTKEKSKNAIPNIPTSLFITPSGL